MLSLKEIEKQYPAELRPFKSFLLREYLQHKILEIIYNSDYSSRLIFMGGTCLRIVHNNNRFSEDLDFDNSGLSEKEFLVISKLIQTELEKEGYEIEMKNVMKGAFHCHIRFPGLLFQEGLTGHKEQKILIQLDTEPQHFKYEAEEVILNRFDVFTEIFVTPLPVLLSQKLYAILNRKQPKGRDFFDTIFLLARTNPNYAYLKQKVAINNAEELRHSILKKCASIDMPMMVKDVQEFLFQPNDKKKVVVFEKYFQKVQL